MKHLKIRPEFRHDWNNHGAFGTNNTDVVLGLAAPQKSNTMFNMDFVFLF